LDVHTDSKAFGQVHRQTVHEKLLKHKGVTSGSEVTELQVAVRCESTSGKQCHQLALWELGGTQATSWKVPREHQSARPPLDLLMSCVHVLVRVLLLEQVGGNRSFLKQASEN